MFEDGDVLNFESEENTRKAVPQGTVAHVQVRPDRDGVLGNFRSGESAFGPWMIVPFEVVEGEFKGQWANLMLNLKPSDFKFRKTFQAVTDIDISSGGQVSFKDFKDKLLTGVFEAEIGPEVRKGEETGYTTVTKVLKRVGDRSAVSQDTDLPGIGTSADVSEDDIPF